MMLYSAQEAFIGCIPAPDPGTGINRWDSQIGYYGGIYYNQSSGPVTIESVSLLHPHNLILHGAAVYKVAHFKISLSYEWAWGHEGTALSATQWAAIRQRIPGATIPPGNGPIAPADFMKLRPDVYEIAVDMSAASPAGGWTPGVVVTYRAGGTTYTSTLMVGLAVQTPVLDLRRADTLRPGLLEGTLTGPSSCTHVTISPSSRRHPRLPAAPVLRALARAPGPCGNCLLAGARGDWVSPRSVETSS
jgi:hypothetical protein